MFRKLRNMVGLSGKKAKPLAAYNQFKLQLEYLEQREVPAVLVGFEVNGIPGSPTPQPATLTAVDVLTGVATTPATLNTLTRTTVTPSGATANAYNSQGWNITNTFNQATNYISFTVAPAAGNTLTLESLQHNMQGSNTAPNTGRWGYSTDGGATFTLQPTFTMTGTTTARTWDFADFTATGNVEFRYWSFGTTSINGGTSAATGTTRIGDLTGRDLVLNGTVGTSGNPTVSIAPTNANQAEGNSGSTPFTFTVTRANSTGTASVDWAVTGSGANPANATDFAGGVLPSGTVNFTGTDTTATVTINVNGDTVSELNEGFTVTLSNPTGGLTLGTSTATGTIQNDDGFADPTSPTGDVAIIGYNTSGTPDSFTIVLMRDLPAGTTFFANDNEYSNTNGTFNDLNEAEAQFTANANLARGTVITLPWGAAAVSNDLYTWSSTTGAGLGNNSEEIYLYTASAITSTTPTAFVTMAKIGSGDGGDIPTTLTTGFTAITPTGSAARYKTAGATYTGTLNTLLTAIGNTAANWEAVAPVAPGDWTFSVTNAAAVDATIALSSVTYQTTEGNSGSVNAVITLTRTGNLASSVSVNFATSPGATNPATAGTDYTTVNQTVTFAANQTVATVSIPVLGDIDIEPNETVAVTLSAPTVVTGTGAALLGTPSTTTLTILDDDSTAPTGLLLNEIYFNPPGTDTPLEYVEIRNTTASPVSLNNVYYVAVEGDDVAATAGSADLVVNLTGQTIPANGFLVIKSSLSTLNFGSAVQVNNSLFDTGTGAIENGSNTHFLVFSAAPIVQGTDYDADNNGTLEGALASATVLDRIGYRDDGASDLIYGPAIPRFSNVDPDSISRFPTNTSTSAGAWFGGALVSTLPLTYAETIALDGLPLGAVVTPGAANYATPAAGEVRFAAAGFTGNEGGNITVTLTRTGGSTGAVTAVVTASELSSQFPGTESYRASNGSDFAASPAAVPIIGATWSAGTATITTSGAHGLSVGDYVAVAGIDPSGFNGGFVVTAVGSSSTFSYALATNPGAYLGLGTSQRGFGVTWAAGDSADKSFTIAVPQDTDAEGNESFDLRIAGVSGGAVTTIRTAAGVINAADLATAAPVVYINEVKVDAAGSDGPFEYIELRGAPNQVLTNVYVVSVEGDAQFATITGATWSSGTATLTVSDSVGILVGDQLVVSGVISAGPGSFNGTFTVTAVTATTISYALAADPGAYDATASGSNDRASGPQSAKPGTFDRVFNLNDIDPNTAGNQTAQLGSNGLLIIRGANGHAAVDPATTVVVDTRLDESAGVLENGTVSHLVIYSTSALVQATTPAGGAYELASDYDRDNNGSLEELTPIGAVLLDGIGWNDGDFGDISYGSFLTSGPTAFPPNMAATRVLESTTPFSPNGFRQGDLLFTTNAELGYDFANANAPSGAALTPGGANFSQVANPNGTFAFTTSVVNTTEGSTVVLTVTRLGGTSGAIDVPYTVANLGTTTSADYGTPTPASPLQWADGESGSKTITITIVDDTENEGAESFTVTLGAPTGGASLGSPSVATITIAASDAPASGPTVFINEIHYDNTGTDADEGIEIAGPAGTNLSGWSIVAYNGNGGGLAAGVNGGAPVALSGTIPNQDDGYGTLYFLIAGLENGAPDGVALVNNLGVVVQFLSWEGSFTATAGAANGLTSVDIGVDEDPAPAVGQSLQLIGTGTVYGDFTWSGPIAHTRGLVNTTQDFVGGPDTTPPTVTITDNVSGGPVTVGAVVTYTLTFSEPVTGVELGDFSNFGTAAGTFGTLTGSGASYTVQFTTTGAGTAVLRVSNAGAVIEDAAGNDLATPVNDDTTITVNAAGDTTPPTIAPANFVDNVSGGPVTVNTAITYTLTFSEDIINTGGGAFTAADLNNAGTAAITIGTITETSPGVFTVEVTPTAPGTLNLRIPTGAVITDLAGNALTGLPIADNTTITVNAAGSVYSFTSATYAAAEGQSFVAVTVTRTGTGAAGSVDVVTANGTATSTADYTGGTYTASFISGQATATVNIPVVDDAVVDDNETFTVALQNPTGGTTGGTTSGTVTIADPVLAVTAVTATVSGFVATFNRAFQTSMLNVYEPTTAGTTLGAADVTLKLGGNMLYGSVVLDSNLPNQFTYVVSDTMTSAATALTGVLTPGATYAYAIKGGANAFQGRDGRVMMTAAANITGPALPGGNSPYVVSVANFARMATESVSVPANNTTAGIPIFLDRVAGTAATVDALEFNIVYDPAVLTITNTATTPLSGFSIIVNDNLPGAGVPSHLRRARVVLTTGGAGVSVAANAHIPIAYLTATVPANTPIGAKHVLDIQAAKVADTTFGALVDARDNDGVHVAASFADVDGNKSLDSLDFTRVFQVSARLEESIATDIFPGFAASGAGTTSFQLLDPAIIADIDQSGSVPDSLDATRVAQNAADPANPAVVPQIPVVPAAPNAAPGGADPRLYVTTFAARPFSFTSSTEVAGGDNPVTGQATPGTTIKYTIRMHVTEDAGLLFEAGQMNIQFDPTRFSIDNITTRVPGFVTTTNSGFNTTGLLNIVMGTGTAGQTYADGTDVALIDFEVTVLPGAATGTSPLDLQENNGVFRTSINGGNSTLNPAPTNADNDARIDGGVEVVGQTTRIFVPAATNASPGGTINVPVSLFTPTGYLLEAAQFNLEFDPTQLQVTNVVTNVPGFVNTTNSGFNTTGLLNAVFGTGGTGYTLAANETLQLAVVTFTVIGTGGTTPLDIQANNGVFVTSVNGNNTPLSPAPTNGNTDANIDGVINIVQVLNQPPFVSVPPSALAQAANPVKAMAGRALAFNGGAGNPAAITVSDPNAADVVRITASVPTGTLTINAAGVTLVSGNGTGTVVFEGSTSALNTALATLTYRSPAAFSGNVLLSVTANDQSINLGGAYSDTKYVNITVVRAFINEVLFNGPSNDAPNEYIEIRSTVPNYTFPANTFFVGIEANGTGAGAGGSAGAVNELFNLSGASTGANGILLIRQNTSTWATGDGNVVTSSATGFSGLNGSAASGFITFSSNNASPVGEVENAGTSFLLLTVDDGAGTNPSLATDIDADNNGVIDGTQYATWAVNDSIGLLAPGTTLPNYSYASTTYRPSGSSGTGITGSTLITGTAAWAPGYAARVGNSTGTLSGDWLISDGSQSATGAVSTWTIGANSFTGASGTFSNKLLNSQTGRPNFFVNAISGVAVNGGGAQRSQVTNIVVNFFSPVTAVNAAAITLTGWTGAVATSVALAPDGLSARITFTGGADTYALANPYLGSSVALLDGRYQLVIGAGAFSDAAGGIDIDGDGSAGGTLTVDFHRFFGDTDGDADVDATDRSFFYSMTDNNEEDDFSPDGVIDSKDTGYIAFLDYEGNGIALAGDGTLTGSDVTNITLNSRRRRLATGAPGAGVPASYLSFGPRI